MRWRQDRATGECIPIEERHTKDLKDSISPGVRRDIAPYISPIDGSIISGRRAERDHNKQHNVSNDLDSLREQSARVKTSNTTQHQRKLAIKDSMERVQSSGFHRHIQYED